MYFQWNYEDNCSPMWSFAMWDLSFHFSLLFQKFTQESKSMERQFVHWKNSKTLERFSDSSELETERMCETSDHLSLWLSLSLQMCEYVHCTWTPHAAVVQHLLPIDLSFIACCVNYWSAYRPRIPSSCVVLCLSVLECEILKSGFSAFSFSSGFGIFSRRVHTLIYI